MTRDQLQACTRKHLAGMAREAGILGWHDMRKEELILALQEYDRKARRKSRSRQTSADTPQPDQSPDQPRKKNAPVAPFQTAAARNTSGNPSPEEQVESSKFDTGSPTRDLSAKAPQDLPSGYGKDRILVMVRDPYWLHCYWELTHHAVSRAEAALGHEWHTARPILRLLDVSSRDTTSNSESVVRDIEIHGGCNNWYIDVNSPPRSFRVDIGYITRSGRFCVLARSNVVITPRAGVSDVIDENWADIDARKADRIYAMSGGFDPTASSLELKQLFEERLRRPLGSPAMTSFGGSSAIPGGKPRQFSFQIDAELIVYGSTDPTSRVTLMGEPVKLRSDGTFTMRFRLPDSRQIIAAVATSPDGVEERTVVLAIERNTKHLEPMIHEASE
jgi:hypothetical protein